MFLRFLLFFLSILLFSSCSKIFMKLGRIEMFDSFDQTQYERRIKPMLAAYSGPKASFVLSDTAMWYYITMYDSIPAQRSTQPIQLLYFKDKELVSYQLNCYAKGTPLGKLDWNYNNRFDTRIPKTAMDFSGDKIDLDQLLSTLNLPVADSIRSNKEVMVLFWTRMIWSQTYSLHDLMVRNAMQTGQKDLPAIIYVNTDKFFAQEMAGKNNVNGSDLGFLSEEQIEKVKGWSQME